MSLTTRITEVLLYLSWRNATLRTTDASTRTLALMAGTSKVASSHNILISNKFGGADGPGSTLEAQTVYILLECENTNISSEISVLSRHGSDSVFLLTECIHSVRNELAKVGYPFAVFASSVTLLSQGNLLRVLTVRGKDEIRTCSINLLSSNSFIHCLHDGMGTELLAHTLNYSPFVTARKNSSHDTFEGYIVDLWTYIASMANLTLSIVMEPSGLWGQFPKPGGRTNNSSGMIGQMLDNKIDVPLSVWSATIRRSPWADFSYGTRDADYFCFTDRKNMHGLDLYFQVHPLTDRSWLAILLTTISLFILSKCAARSGCQNLSEAVSLLGGLVFTIVAGFYGGALTMFLSHSPEPPYSNVLDVAFSKQWNLILPAGEENIFRRQFNMKDPRVIAADRKFNSDEYRKTQAPNAEGSIRRLQDEPNSIMYISELRMHAILGTLESDVNLDVLKFCNMLRIQVCTRMYLYSLEKQHECYQKK